MKIAALASAGLLAGSVLLTTTTAQADPVAVDPDPVVAVQELQGQVAELHDNWATLSPDERNRRLTALQVQATLVDAETRDLTPIQQLQVQGMLLSTAFQLADLLHRL